MDSFSRIVRLGEGVRPDRPVVRRPPWTRTIAALKICSDRIAKYKVAACARHPPPRRRGWRASADVLVARAKDEAGLDLTVISAEEEADLAAEGCAPLIGSKYKGALVFDIGGGSTEIIWLQKTPDGPQARLTASVPVGVVSLAEELRRRLDQAAPASSGCVADLRTRFEPFAKKTGADFDIAKNHLLGTSGTVTTLAAIALKLPRYNRTKVDASWHETAHMLRVVERLVGQDTQMLAKIGSIGPERADLMLPGCAIFAAIWLTSCGRRRCFGVADRGLREGMLRRLSRELAWKQERCIGPRPLRAREGQEE